MSLKFTAKIFILSFFVSSYAYAVISNSKIPCPPVSVIQQASNKIDRAAQFDESYIAVSSMPVYSKNGKQWGIDVQLNAKSRKEAIAIGRKAVKQINICEQEYANEPGNGAIYCEYGPVKFGLVTASVIK